MVLYFTGTGNSRYLARRIAEGLDMPLYDLNACIKAGDTAPVLGCAEMEAETGEMRQELADLREVVFHQQSGAEEENTVK